MNQIIRPGSAPSTPRLQQEFTAFYSPRQLIRFMAALTGNAPPRP